MAEPAACIQDDNRGQGLRNGVGKHLADSLGGAQGRLEL